MRNHILAAMTAVSVLASASAWADLRMIYPNRIDLGELEFEHNGSRGFDHRSGMGGGTSSTLEIGTGLTQWWKTELEVEFEREPGGGQPTLLTGIVTENLFQLAEPGEYFIDPAFYVEYGQSLTRGKYAGSNQVTFGPVIGKDVGHTTHTLNLFFTRQLGPNQENHGFEMSYAWQSRWNIWAPLSPAIEIYGDSGIVGQSPRLSQQQLLIGPVGVGRIQLSDLGLGNAGKLRYEVGWLFGATQASPAGALRWRLEFEVPF
jgi:hypothetical protein